MQPAISRDISWSNYVIVPILNYETFCENIGSWKKKAPFEKIWTHYVSDISSFANLHPVCTACAKCKLESDKI